MADFDLNSVTYEIRFREIKDNPSVASGGTIASNESTKSQQLSSNGVSENNIKQSNEIVSKKGSFINKTVGTLATLYGVSQVIVKPILTHQINTAMLNGDYVQAKNIQRVSQLTDKLVNTGFSLAKIGISFAINPALGVVSALSEGVNVATSIINTNEQNRVIREQNQINNFINSIEGSRLINSRGAK